MNIFVLYKNQKTFINVILTLLVIGLSIWSSWRFYQNGQVLQRFTQVKKEQFRLVEKLSKRLVLDCQSLDLAEQESTANALLDPKGMRVELEEFVVNNYKQLIFKKLILTVMDKKAKGISFSTTGRVVVHKVTGKCSGLI